MTELRPSPAAPQGAGPHRFSTFLTASTLLALGVFPAVALMPASSRAQSSGAQADEFDDEFGAEPTPARRAPATIEDDDDGFGTTAATPAPAMAEDDEIPPRLEERSTQPEAPRGRQVGAVHDARGELLRSNGSEAWRQRRFVFHNSYFGSTGGLHVVDAGSGPSQSFRIGLMTDFFFQNGFLLPNDDNRHIGGSLSANWTPFDFLEIFASLQSYANSNTQESPNLFQVLGDSVIGAKGFYEVLPWLTVGGDVSVAFLNAVGGIGLDSTSFGLRANATADFRALSPTSSVPLVIRFGFQYYFDNSAALVDEVEEARYRALSDPRSCPDRSDSQNCIESRHLISRVERFALNINRHDRINIGLGVELPLNVAQDFSIHPLAEWTWGVPVNRQGYSCLDPRPSGVGTIPATTDSCMLIEGVNAMPMNLSLGVRVLPPVRGLGLTAAVDIGLTGTSTNVRELAANAPYNVYLGISYSYDTVAPYVEPEVREVERRVEIQAPAPVRGRIVGMVVEQGTSNGIAGAVVAMPGRDLTALSSAGDGRFVTYELEPGEVRFDITHPEYHAGSCAGTVPAEGGDVNVSCELAALPRMGNVNGHVVDEASHGVGAATVTITGPVSFTATTDPSGGFVRGDLPPGSYTARVESETHLISSGSFEVRARETTNAEISVVSRPRRSLVQLRARELVIRRQVNFATDSADILPDSEQLLTEVADALLRHPEVTQIEIQGHTDNRGGAEHNLDLSQRRAEAVREWLVRAGVGGERLQARGYGDTQPLVPNITAGNRARNRRVQFIIQSRTE